MRRVVVAGAESARTALSRGGFRTDCLFLTLTYRWDYQWQPTQVAWFLKRLKAFCARAGVAVRYQWVLELTQRGRPHYHVLLWVPRGFRIPKPDQSGLWPHGLTQVKRAYSPVGYVIKYSSKAVLRSMTSRRAHVCSGLVVVETRNGWLRIGLACRCGFSRVWSLGLGPDASLVLGGCALSLEKFSHPHSRSPGGGMNGGFHG